MGLLFVLQTHLSPLCFCFRAQEESTGLLSGLRIWHTQLLPGGLQGLILNPVFRQNLRIALLGGYVTPSPPKLGRGNSTSGGGAPKGPLWNLVGSTFGSSLAISWTRCMV